MRIFARINWTNKERTRGRVILLWRCSIHNLGVRCNDLREAPPLCPRCAGFQGGRKSA